MDTILGQVIPYWDTIVAVAGIVTGLLAVVGAIAELTPWEWDNRVINPIRRFWAKIPIFSRNSRDMGIDWKKWKKNQKKS